MTEKVERKIRYWLKPSTPDDNNEVIEHDPIGPFDKVKLSYEDLRDQLDKTIAQCYDDNYWRITRQFNKRIDVDGWKEIEIYAEEIQDGN